MKGFVRFLGLYLPHPCWSNRAPQGLCGMLAILADPSLCPACSHITPQVTLKLAEQEQCGVATGCNGLPSAQTHRRQPMTPGLPLPSKGGGCLGGHCLGGRFR